MGYLAAALSFVVSNPDIFWPPAESGPITRVAAYIGVPAFAVWLVTVGLVVRRDGLAAWWVWLCAPFALWTPLRIVAYVLGFVAWASGGG